jgi:hypothetical protein
LGDATGAAAYLRLEEIPKKNLTVAASVTGGLDERPTDKQT